MHQTPPGRLHHPDRRCTHPTGKPDWGQAPPSSTVKERKHFSHRLPSTAVASKNEGSRWRRPYRFWQGLRSHIQIVSIARALSLRCSSNDLE